MALVNEIEELVSDIPPGKVMTYGDIAACLGRPGAGRLIGMVAASGSAGVPWHRVVNAVGRLAPSFREQGQLLADEGVRCDGDRVVDFKDCRWLPAFQ